MCGAMAEPSKMAMDRMSPSNKAILSLLAVTATLVGCGGSDGVNGTDGQDGKDAVVHVEPTLVIVTPTPVEIVASHDNGNHKGPSDEHGKP